MNKDKILKKLDELKMLIQGKPEKREKKNYVAIGTSGILGEVEESILRKTEGAFAEPGVFSKTGQLRIDSLTLLELSQEIGTLLTWKHTIQTAYAELRVIKVTRTSMSYKVIEVSPDNS